MQIVAPANASFDAHEFLKNVTNKPGVYRMLDAEGTVLYVGKAHNLKKRLTSYFHRSGLTTKTLALVSQIRQIEVTVTRSEKEALILENNLIKQLKPRYNILLRDDKSYPYIYLTSHQDFPRLSFYRGARSEKGRFFGPYPSAGAVRETLSLLQKVFPVRQCEDSFYRNRSRPCLQYQIKRCTAPCVNLVDKEAYREDVQHAEMFLEGKSTQVIDELVKRMETAAEKLDFERAVRYRDQIAKLRRIQEKQYVAAGADSDRNIDVIVCIAKNGTACVQVFFIRRGLLLGNKNFFPAQVNDETLNDILSAFLPQYYLGKEIPDEIIVSEDLTSQNLLEQVLTSESGHKVSITFGVRGERARWLEMAKVNAELALNTYLISKAGMRTRWEALQQAFDLPQTPERVECFDISHTMGEATVASCVVFGREGPGKNDYRRFNIENITPGDDYAAMKQALSRRYARLKRGEGKLPDILFIDGGKGQIAQAEEVLNELDINNVCVMGIAKGPERRPGMETLFLSGRQGAIILPPDSPALHLIQQIRDEAHRFAITGHRQRRGKARTTSQLEQIPGLGPKRRRTLLTQFGGIQEVARAGVEDLANVQGISQELAQRIYDVFHADKT